MGAREEWEGRGKLHERERESNVTLKISYRQMTYSIISQEYPGSQRLELIATVRFNPASKLVPLRTSLVPPDRGPLTGNEYKITGVCNEKGFANSQSFLKYHSSLNTKFEGKLRTKTCVRKSSKKIDVLD